MAHRGHPDGPFFLSVACYVVKPEVQKFKREKKCRGQQRIRRFQQKTADFVELLSRFELETSSLPIRQTWFYLVPIRVSKSLQVLAPQGLTSYRVSPYPSTFYPVCWKICWKAHPHPPRRKLDDSCFPRGFHCWLMLTRPHATFQFHHK